MTRSSYLKRVKLLTVVITVVELTLGGLLLVNPFNDIAFGAFLFLLGPMFGLMIYASCSPSTSIATGTDEYASACNYINLNKLGRNKF